MTTTLGATDADIRHQQIRASAAQLDILRHHLPPVTWRVCDIIAAHHAIHDDECRDVLDGQIHRTTHALALIALEHWAEFFGAEIEIANDAAIAVYATYQGVPVRIWTVRGQS